MASGRPGRILPAAARAAAHSFESNHWDRAPEQASGPSKRERIQKQLTERLIAKVSGTPLNLALAGIGVAVAAVMTTKELVDNVKKRT